MKTKILLSIIIFSLIISGFVFAQNTSTSTVTLIEQLKQQIATLQAQINQLREQIRVMQQTREQIREMTLQLRNQLKEGMSGEDVKLLQEFLASDPDIYPKAFITGYFGALTKNALKRFQKKSCLPETGNVDEKTLWKINELLKEGAGKSGKIPPGLLRAPGILKKLCATSTPTTTFDVIPPYISNISANVTSSSTASISWKTDENANSKVYYSQITPVDPQATTTLIKTDNSFVKDHLLNLTELSADTIYYYFVVSNDRAGNVATSTEFSFKTSL